MAQMLGFGLYKHLEKKKEKHYVAVVKYQLMTNKIEAVLNTPKQERETSHTVMKTFSDEQEHLLNESPQVSSRVIKMFKTKFPDAENPPGVVGVSRRIKIRSLLPLDMRDINHKRNSGGYCCFEIFFPNRSQEDLYVGDEN